MDDINVFINLGFPVQTVIDFIHYCKVLSVKQVSFAHVKLVFNLVRTFFHKTGNVEETLFEEVTHLSTNLLKTKFLWILFKNLLGSVQKKTEIALLKKRTGRQYD